MSRLHLRPATMQDAELLLAWVNSPTTLAQKRLTAQPIDLETHQRWLANRLSDPATVLRMIVVGDRPVGQVRVQLDRGTALIDIYVEPDSRRGGVASAAVSRVLQELPAGFASIARAEVHEDNAGSRRLFSCLGFTENGNSDSFVTYEHSLPFRGIS